MTVVDNYLKGKKNRKSKIKNKKALKKSVKKRGCSFQFTRKYMTRPSPPYPANECKNKKKIGNDGEPYRSVGNKNGVFTWKRL